MFLRVSDFSLPGVSIIYAIWILTAKTPRSPGSDRSRQIMFLAENWERQQKRGFQPPTRAEVDADLAAERDSWSAEPLECGCLEPLW
jgi:hypothetical protein